MKAKIKILLRIACCTVGDDFIKTLEDGISLAPSTLIEDISHFLEETVGFINLTIWQATEMVGYAHAAYLNVFVDEITIHAVTIVIPRNSITPEDVLREDRRVRDELAKFKIDSRDKAIGHIVCSKKSSRK